MPLSSSSMWCTATLHLHDFPSVWFSVALWHCQCLSLTCCTEDSTAPKGKEWLFFSSLVSKNGFPSQTNGSLSEPEREMRQRIWDMQKRWNADLCHFEDFSLLLDLSVFWWWAWSAVKLICAFKSLDFYFGSVLVTGFSSVTWGQ